MYDYVNMRCHTIKYDTFLGRFLDGQRRIRIVARDDHRLRHLRKAHQLREVLRRQLVERRLRGERIVPLQIRVRRGDQHRQLLEAIPLVRRLLSSLHREKLPSLQARIVHLQIGTRGQAGEEPLRHKGVEVVLQQPPQHRTHIGHDQRLAAGTHPHLVCLVQAILELDVLLEERDVGLWGKFHLAPDADRLERLQLSDRVQHTHRV